MSSRPIRTPVTSRPQSPQHTQRYRHQFAGSSYAVDDLVPSRSQSRARPAAALPDLEVEDILTRQTRPRESSEFTYPQQGVRENVGRNTRFQLPTDVYPSSRILGHPIAPTSAFDINLQDERGEEMSKDARIWRVYVDEANKADTIMTEGWNRSLDVLLVFTGLFSAVLSTFIVQTYSQLLLPDPADTTNALLAELMLLQFNTSTATSQSVRPIAYRSHSITPQARGVNGLWFAALVCSLSSALISMLAKQWLMAYMPSASGSLRNRARMRQSRFMHLQAWHVPTIINALPLLLHAALLFFFAGLVLLLWDTDLGITLSTLCIVAVVYFFYATSLVLPLLYTDCPYRNPVAEQLQKWSFTKFSKLSPDPSTRVPDGSPGRQPEKQGTLKSNSHASRDDLLDAEILCWLFSKSTDERIIATALQAIAGLPSNFSAFHILREAGALRFVEQGFQSCFHKDTSVDMQWHLVDVEGAELYCRAWMRLTWGTAEKWPLEIIDPLWILSDLKKSHPDAAAYAACAVALSSFDTLSAQWELLSFLANYVTEETQLAQITQCWLLDCICQCLHEWEVPQAVIDKTTAKAVPIILGILRLADGVQTSNVRNAATLALYAFTCGPIDLAAYDTEDKRRAAYCEMTVQALAVIVNSPESYGVKDTLLDLAAEELAYLALPVVAQSERFPHSLRSLARASLTKLFISGRLSSESFPEFVVAKVLQLLFPPEEISPAQRPIFVAVLVDTLETSSDSELTNWAIRLLEALLTQCQMSVCQAFANSNGISAVLKAAKAGNVDSRRLQIDSLRVLCAFIYSNTSLYTGQDYSEGHPDLDRQFDLIFQSEFFEILCSVVASRRWWLFEVSGHWMPALLQLCRIRPTDAVWQDVVDIFQEFAERNIYEEGHLETTMQLREMRGVISPDSDSGSFTKTVV